METPADTLVVPSKPSGWKRLLNSLTEVDTNYVRTNPYNMQAMAYSDMLFNIYRLSGEDDNGENPQSISFSPYSKIQVGPYIAYSIIFLGYTFNIGRKETSSDRSNIFFSVYSPIIGLDYYYQKGENNYRIKSVSGFGDPINERIKNTAFHGMNTYLKSFNLYYVFNHKRFSYTAAYSQSGQQLKSAGSFMLGFSSTKQKLDFNYLALPDYLLTDEAGNNLLNESLKISNINYRNYSLNIGYSYNWAFAKNALFNITIAPSIGYNINKGEKLELNSDLFKYKSINFDLISRSAIVWNTGRFYAGASCVAHTYGYKKASFSILNALFKVNAYAGFSFWKKKSYRKKT